ncbi:unnamed protein product, partial [Iphiclides podalirius]
MALESCAGGGAAGATVAAALQFFAASQCLLQEAWPHHSTVPNASSFDFIVVGGGTAGSVVAARLSELRGVSVLLLEAGGDPPQESIIPGYRNTLKASRYDWNFTTMDDGFSSQALRDGSQRQPRGRMLGGSGSLNDMVYARGFPADYAEWGTTVGDEWGWDRVLEYFKKTEHLTDERIVNDPELSRHHGVGGEIQVSGTSESTHTTDRYLEAFEELGFKVVKDMTYPNGIGVGRFSHTIKEGRRHSSLTALLNGSARRDNLYVLKDAHVAKVLIENRTAIGVSVMVEDEEFHYYAAREVVLSSGTFNTPKLLMLSGIGPEEHLNELGIAVVQDLPVGDNLHDHVMVLTYLSADSGTCEEDERDAHMDAIKYLYDRSGALSRTTDVGAYLSLTGDPNVPDFAFYPTCMPRDSGFYEGCFNVLGFKREICEKLAAENKDRELMSLAVVCLKPKSRGRVRLRSADYWDEPLIYSGTFGHPDDLEGFPRALEVAWAVASTSYFKSKNARVVNIGIDECTGLEGSDRSKCIARNTAMSAWHSVGTAAMGTVVDSRLRARASRGTSELASAAESKTHPVRHFHLSVRRLRRHRQSVASSATGWTRSRHKPLPTPLNP